MDRTMEHFLELPWWGALGFAVALFSLAHELGFRLGRRGAKGPEDRRAQVSVLVAALLGLLGLLLAFSFSIVEGRFAARKALVLDEANAIGTSYLRAKLLPEPHAARIARLLRRYVDVRLSPRTPEELGEAIARSEAIHAELWNEAEAVGEAHPESEVVGRFLESLNEVIDLHTSRVTVALHQRLPLPIFSVLIAVSVLSIAVLGYGSGLVAWRSPAPTIALVLAVASVIVLIGQLDSPHAPLFRVSQYAMEDVRDTMEPGPRPRPRRQ